ncbi:MAG: penicillin acylase family protein [Pseudomonadota bacterium]
MGNGRRIQKTAADDLEEAAAQFMQAMFKLLTWTFAGLVVLALGAAALGYYLMSRSVPDYDMALVLDGLDGEVEIIRDANAVPHIYASTDADAYYALGLVHAQERLWQMELSRRGAQGRLSELFGEAALPIDIRLRALDLHGLAREALKIQEPPVIEALEAYAAGVNAWISTTNEQALGRGAPEFFVFGEGLAPWTPADSMGVLKVMAMRLTDAAELEVRRAKLLSALTPEEVGDIFPSYPDNGLLALPSYADAYPDLAPNRSRARAEPTELERLFFPQAGYSAASNAWAVTGSRATTGAPLLATDPHLWLSAPSLWMLTHVEFPDGGVIGASIAGLPAIVIGRNRDFGWGVTATHMDDQDLFIEKVNPDNPDEYLTPDGWMPFITRKENIRISGAPTKEVTLRWTRHGPVLPSESFDVGAVTPDGHVAALGWTSLTTEDRAMQFLLENMRARTIEEAVSASRNALAPSINSIMADKDGVGVIVAGRPPRRSSASKTRGRIPGLGWIPENDWDGLIPMSETPRSIRPRSGIVANANNRVTNAPYPRHISFDWATPYRIRRVEQRLNDREFHTRESFMELQNDAVSEMARAVLPLMARDLWWTRDEGVGDPRGDRREAVLKLMADWNGEMSEHAAEPLIFTAWVRALTRRIAADELGVLFSEIEGARPLFIERVFYDVSGAGKWCDVDKTIREESCAEMSKQALDDALDELTEAYGDDPETWRWGEAHVARHSHSPLGGQFPFNLFVNIEHETSGGDYTLLRAKTPGKGEAPYQNVHAAGFRAVYDFGDLDRSVFIISTGQSGHVLSHHYDDQAELWRSGQYIPMTMNREDIEAGALGVTRLSPVNNDR